MTSGFRAFSILCDDWGACTRHFGCTPKHNGCPREALGRLMELWAKLAVFRQHRFYLKEQLTNYGIQSWERSGRFLRVNQINLSLQRKHLMIFVVGYSKENSNFWKICIHHCEFHSFSKPKHFSEELSGDVNKCEFGGLSFKEVATFGRYV